MKQCKNIPYCCIDTTKSRFDFFVLIQSNIKDAGIGAFSKTPMKKDKIICHYADIPVRENLEGRDYLVETAIGEVFNGFYKKQFNFHSTSSLCFYSSASPCPLRIKSLSSALKASKIIGHLLLRNSQDPLVSSCVPKLRTGSWKFEDAVLSFENNIKISQVCGNGHQGLDTPLHPKSLKTNLQNITRDIFQTITKQLMTPMPSPKLSNCRFRVSGQDGSTMFSKTFLGPL